MARRSHDGWTHALTPPLHVDALGQATLGRSDLADLREALVGPGLWFDVGAACIHLQSDSPALAAQLKAAYPAFPLVTQAPWADVHVSIERAPGVRRWLRPQVVLRCDGQWPFDPFPADSPLPLFEWGCNWTLGQRLNHLLLLHAGALERDGRVLILPATPGSGKSTLSAALSTRGWRLLSDEFGAFDPTSGSFQALLKPVALKNASIEALRSFSPQSSFGPEFPRTRKGRLVHMAADADAVARRHDRACPGAVVLPRWEAGSKTRWEPLPEHSLFAALAFNAFNYALLGPVGFRAVVQIVRQCPGWQLVYSDLEDAVQSIDARWPQMLRHPVEEPA